MLFLFPIMRMLRVPFDRNHTFVMQLYEYNSSLDNLHLCTRYKCKACFRSLLLESSEREERIRQSSLEKGLGLLR